MTISVSRRSFIMRAAAFIAAPAVIPIGALMPVSSKALEISPDDLNVMYMRMYERMMEKMLHNMQTSIYADIFRDTSTLPHQGLWNVLSDDPALHLA